VQRELADLRELGPLLTELQARSLFLVIDRRAFDASGAHRQLQPLLDQREITTFEDFENNPRLEHVLSGVRSFRRTESDVILAIGGGTAIDVAKLIRCFSTQTASPEKIIEDPTQIVDTATCPLVAVPTTSGTGSEATHFAVVYVDGVKHSVAHDSIMPEVAVVASELTASMPPRLTAVTGLDVLCQAIESMWSVHSIPQSHRYAVEALELVLGNLHAAVHQPTPPARAAMSRAANLAGKAINISKTTAPHAISYAITMNHGVPHGHAVALTLAPFLVFNNQITARDTVDRRGVDHVRGVLDQINQTLACPNAHESAVAMTSFIASLGCQTRLCDVGVVTAAQRARIARSVNAARLSNNPRAVNEEDIREILETIR
jgi:alcohol dehydrogenase class IV